MYTIQQHFLCLITDSCLYCPIIFSPNAVIVARGQKPVPSSLSSVFLLPSCPAPPRPSPSLRTGLCWKRMSGHFDCFTVYFDLRGTGLEFWLEPPGVPQVTVRSSLTTHLFSQPLEDLAPCRVLVLFLSMGHQ